MKNAPDPRSPQQLPDLLHDSTRLHQELAAARAAVAADLTDDDHDEPLGVSIIVPSYRGVDRLPRLLRAIGRQTLDRSSFEVVLIFNGEPDGSIDVVEQMLLTDPGLPLRWFHVEQANAAAARNLGLEQARYRYTTFVDDDDDLQPRFLEAGLEAASPTTIGVVPIVDVHADGTVDSNTLLAGRLRMLPEDPVAISSTPWLLGFNACKFIPTALARTFHYDEGLRSGEDVAYFAHLLTQPHVRANRTSELSDACYIRHHRPGSLSRQADSRRFLVDERLAVITTLVGIALPAGSEAAEARASLVEAQAGFIRRYLDLHPHHRDRLSQTIADLGIAQFPWSVLNRDTATDLVFAYCFAPFSDTSAAVTAKIVNRRAVMVDVISNDMTGVRHHDHALGSVAHRWIDRHILIETPPTFAHWGNMAAHAERAVAAAEHRNATMTSYRSVYSRALWAGSHAAAALFKLRHWNTPWTAEFSDPLRRNAIGAPREGGFDADHPLARRLIHAIRSRHFSHLELATLFDLIELASFVLADELIFTNDNQREYMLSLWPSRRLARMVSDKATIRPHPQPPAIAYEVQPSRYHVPEHLVNLAYFGSFYPNRSIDEVLLGMQVVAAAIRPRLRLHVFCNQPQELQEHVDALGIADLVSVNSYLPYLEFLNASTKFDVLIVNDVKRTDALPLNPYLPSKYADYVGSGQAIWSLVDDGSPLSRLEATFTTEIGDPAGVQQTLLDLSAPGDRLPRRERPPGIRLVG
ncbi:MAG: glycosyltransferase [Propioniciclava sp.]